jgi:hypothetical protein
MAPKRGISWPPRDHSEVCGFSRIAWESFFKRSGSGSRQKKCGQTKTESCFRTGWTHRIAKKTLKIEELEHVLIEKAELLFQTMLMREPLLPSGGQARLESRDHV